jgi:NitT/TauT family transport system substrate-binding protein
MPAMAQSPALQKVRINKIPIAPYVPTEVALSRGWFKDEGIDASIEAVVAGPVAMQSLAAGKLDIIYTSLDVGLRARAQGFDVVILSDMNNAQRVPPDAAAILARNDLGIKSLKDLEGKRLIVNNLQNVNWAYSRQAIRKAGGTPDKVQFLEVEFPHMVDALLGGQADAASITEPFTTIGKGTGKLGVASYMFVDVQPGLNIAGWVANGSWFRRHRETALAFRRVLQKSMDFLNGDAQEKTRAILQFTPLKAELLAQITLDNWTTTIDPGDLARQLEIYRSEGLIDQTYDVKTIIVQ